MPSTEIDGALARLQDALEELHAALRAWSDDQPGHPPDGRIREARARLEEARLMLEALEGHGARTPS